MSEMGQLLCRKPQKINSRYCSLPLTDLTLSILSLLNQESTTYIYHIDLQCKKGDTCNCSHLPDQYSMN